jgi:hypothetical protein
LSPSITSAEDLKRPSYHFAEQQNEWKRQRDLKVELAKLNLEKEEEQ